MSKIRFLKASGYYPSFLEKYYKNNEKQLGSYESQSQDIFFQCFGYSDSWKENFEETGKFIAAELILNAEPLQKQWASENNFKYSPDNWMMEILEEQIVQFNPDVLFAHDYWYLNSEFLKKVKNKCKNLKLIFGMDGIAMNDRKVFSECHLVLSTAKHVTDYYKKEGFETILIKAGFDARFLNRIEKRKKNGRVSFIGSLLFFDRGHFSRYEFLKKVARKMDIDLYLGQYNEEWNFFSKPQIKRLRSGNFSEFLSIWNLGRKNKGEIFGQKMFQTLADSSITLNSHIDRAESKAGNMRLYEATGVGTCLITDWKENIKDFFEPDKEVLTYKSSDECIEKIKYLLNHPREIEKLAAEGQKRTLKDHNLKDVQMQVAEKILKLI